MGLCRTGDCGTGPPERQADGLRNYQRSGLKSTVFSREKRLLSGDFSIIMIQVSMQTIAFRSIKSALHSALIFEPEGKLIYAP